VNKITFIIILLLSAPLAGAKHKKETRFYDFSDQLIGGKLRKPSTLYMEARTRAKFSRLLNLKKSFKQELMSSGKDPALNR
jgi:hypothetical protein